MFRIKVSLALIVLAAAIATAKVMAQNTSSHSTQDTSSHSTGTGTHLIDRLQAIRLLQELLKSNPNDAAAWAALGKLAHEVAQDLSSQRDAASSYIEGRKGELAASGFNSTVQADSPPVPPAPPAAVAATNSAPASQPAVTYQSPVYQPYYVQGAQPYTYQQNAVGYLYAGPEYYTYGTAPGVTTNGAHRRRSER
jgi:hypothetical protein